MSTIHMIMMDKNMDAKDKRNMVSEIDDVDGVKWTISMSSLARSDDSGFDDPGRHQGHAAGRRLRAGVRMLPV